MSADEIAEECGFDSAWDMIKSKLTNEELLDILSDILHEYLLNDGHVMNYDFVKWRMNTMTGLTVMRFVRRMRMRSIKHGVMRGEDYDAPCPLDAQEEGHTLHDVSRRISN